MDDQVPARPADDATLVSWRAYALTLEQRIAALETTVQALDVLFDFSHPLDDAHNAIVLVDDRSRHLFNETIARAAALLPA